MATRRITRDLALYRITSYAALYEHPRPRPAYSRSLARRIPPGYVLEFDEHGCGWACYPKDAMCYAFREDPEVCLHEAWAEVRAAETRALQARGDA